MSIELVETNDTPVHTPPPVTGYRKLSQAEVDLMNEIKAHGAQLEELTKKITGHLFKQRQAAYVVIPAGVAIDDPSFDELEAKADAETERLDRANSEMWLQQGALHAQQALMFLTRAVAQPSTF